jgi:hypothetical protein
MIPCLVQQARDPGRLIADDLHISLGLPKSRVGGTRRGIGVLIMTMLGIGLGSHRDHRSGSEAFAQLKELRYHRGHVPRHPMVAR